MESDHGAEQETNAGGCMDENITNSVVYILVRVSNNTESSIRLPSL